MQDHTHTLVPIMESDGTVSSASNSSKPEGPASPTVNLFFFTASAFLGSIYSYGEGFVKKKGSKQSLVEARSNAKTFAILFGVDSLVVYILARLRGKDDAINAGIAGCCTGLALYYPGTPQALLKSCLTFGALSLISEGLNKKLSAQALTSVHSHTPPPFALPLQLPLSDEMERAFTSFYETLKKCKKDIFPTSH